MMKATLFILLLIAVSFTCRAVEPKKITAEQAKDALVRFIRANPAAFVGQPDPEKLAQLPMQLQRDGRYALGAFVIDVAKSTYSAAIGLQGPEPYFYNGTFVQHDGTWTAEAPGVQRVHAPSPR